MFKKVACLFALVIFLLFHPSVLADTNIVINEIMYDLDGSDTGREWVELFNLGSETVDLTNWRFEEDGTQHTLTLKQGTAQLADGQYALIVDNYDKFLQDNPGYSGNVFDSSFSLSNTGENLKIRDSQNGNVINEVSYSSDSGAAGDGNSLQRKPDGSWIAANPTPGSNNSTVQASSPSPSPTPTSSSSTSQSTTSTKSPTPTPKPSSIPVKSPQPSPLKSPNAVLGERTEEQLLPTSTPETSPAQSPEGKEQKGSSKTKIAAMLTGSGVILIGLSFGFFVLYNRTLNKKDSQEESKDIN